MKKVGFMAAKPEAAKQHHVFVMQGCLGLPRNARLQIRILLQEGMVPKGQLGKNRFECHKRRLAEGLAEGFDISRILFSYSMQERIALIALAKIGFFILDRSKSKVPRCRAQKGRSRTRIRATCCHGKDAFFGISCHLLTVFCSTKSLQ